MNRVLYVCVLLNALCVFAALIGGLLLLPVKYCTLLFAIIDEAIKGQEVKKKKRKKP